MVEVGLRENRKGLGEISFEIQSLATLGNRFLVTPCGAENFRPRSQNSRMERVEFLRGANLLKSLLEAANLGQMPSVPMMGIGAVGI